MTYETLDARRLTSDLTLSVRDEIRGFVFDPNDLATHFVVELLADGLPFGLYRADGYVESLGKSGIGDGCYGFATLLDERLALGASLIEARLANSGEPVGLPLRLVVSKGRRDFSPDTHVRWTSGLRLEGWIEEVQGRPGGDVKALVDGRLVAQVTPDGWLQIARGDGFVVAKTFKIDLPASFADGRARRIEVLAADGSELAGSPCTLVAFADGLEALVEAHADLDAEKTRARSIDRLFPRSWPLLDVAAWQARFPVPKPEAVEGPAVAVVLIGEAGLEASIESLGAAIGCGWTAASLPERGRATTFEAADLADFVAGDAAACDIVVLGPAGTLFAPEALGLFRDALIAVPAAQSVYCDLLMPIAGGGAWPLAFPAFDYERCLEQGYCGLVFAMRRQSVASATEADSLIRLFQTQFDRPLESGAEPIHIPLLLATAPMLDGADVTAAIADAAVAHFRVKRLAARLSTPAGAAFPTVRITRAPEAARVSIIIPTRNRAELLTRCLTSLEDTVGETECEVVIADNDSIDEEALEVIASAERQGIKIVRVPGPFNFSRINNSAVSVATGRYLLLLNNDVEALEPGWLEEMLSRIAEPDVGAVGPMLLWPSGIVQHGGVVLGPDFSAAYAFGDRIGGEPGYGGLMQAAHECSAVTGACLLTRRELYLAQGGLDETHFAVDYNDVDYCLKLRAAGYRVILTPHAKLRHSESSTRGRYERPDQRHRYGRELAALRAKWGDALAADPYYNPSLTLASQPYSGLAWPPRGREPRQPQGWAARDLPPGL